MDNTVIVQRIERYKDHVLVEKEMEMSIHDAKIVLDCPAMSKNHRLAPGESLSAPKFRHPAAIIDAHEEGKLPKTPKISKPKPIKKGK